MDSINYKGVRILLSDYRGLSGQELIDRIHGNAREVIRLGKERNGNLLVLTNTTGATEDSRVLAAFRQTSKEAGPYILANAVIGVQGVRKHMLHFHNISSPFTSRAFDTEADAKEWLLNRAEQNRS